MYFLLFLVIFSLKLSNCQAENDMKPSLDDLFMSPKLIEAKKYSITCQLSNGKQSNVWFEWFVNGKRIQSNENITINQVDDISLLTIRSMSSDYNGEYTCKARNGHLQESKSISIKLNGRNGSFCIFVYLFSKHCLPVQVAKNVLLNQLNRDGQ